MPFVNLLMYGAKHLDEQSWVLNATDTVLPGDFHTEHPYHITKYLQANWTDVSKRCVCFCTVLCWSNLGLLTGRASAEGVEESVRDQHSGRFPAFERLQGVEGRALISY
jgi:hypothetical protein